MVVLEPVLSVNSQQYTYVCDTRRFAPRAAYTARYARSASSALGPLVGGLQYFASWGGRVHRADRHRVSAYYTRQLIFIISSTKYLGWAHWNHGLCAGLCGAVCGGVCCCAECARYIRGNIVVDHFHQLLREAVG